MESIASTTSSTAGQRIGPRPTLPARRLTAEMNPRLRDIDWNGHIPTARTAAGSYTRETLDAAINAADGDGDGPVIPKIPGPRQPSHAYDDVVLGYGIPAHLTAFGAA